MVSVADCVPVWEAWGYVCRFSRSGSIAGAGLLWIVRFSNHSEIPAWHGDMIELGSFDTVPWVFVEEFHQRLIGFVIQMMDLVPSSKEVCDRSGRRMVRYSRGDDVHHIPMVLLNGNAEFRLCVEASESCKVHVAT